MKILLLDIDGVLLLRKKLFSEHLAEDYGIPLDDIMPFFKEVIPGCLVGEKDLKMELQKGWLQKWNWKGSADDLLHYWFTKESRINAELLKTLDEIKRPKYLATQNEKYKCDYIWNELKFKDHFEHLFASSNVYIRKSNPAFFTTVAEKIGVPTSDIIFFDDDMSNVTSAKEAGLESYFYTSNQDLLKMIA